MDQVAQSIQFANKTGKCAVCRVKDREPGSSEGLPGLRMTCGSKECVERWTNPGKFSKGRYHD